MLKRHLFILILIAGFFFAGTSLFAQLADTASYPYWVEMMEDQNANFFETQKAFELYWKDRPLTRGCGFKPFKRWEYMMMQRVDNEGNRPEPDRELKAYNQMLKSGKILNGRENQWTALGPFNVPSGYNGYRGLGRINAIGFDPVDANRIYIGAPAGGLWMTANHGQNWEVLTDHLPTLGVSAILVDRSNPAHILIGTGDRDAGDAPGMGVWRSLDSGMSWEPWNNGMGNAIVGMMIQDALDPLVMLAATNTGIYRTADAGTNWVRVKTGNIKDIVFHPTDHQIIYAASGGNFFRSLDNGLNFSQITSGLPGGSRAVVGVSAASPDMVYFLITTSDAFKGLYRSLDKGATFEMRSNSPNIMSWDCNGGSGGQAWYDLDIAVDPVDANVLYAGGVNCFKSTNGGSNWAIRSHWYGGCNVQSVHADLHILEYSPINNRLYAGNDGGIYWTENAGVNWTEISNGLVISQAYKIGQSRTKRDFVINGYQDNGSSVMNGTNWDAVNGGDGMECAYDPNDHRYSYSSIYYGSIERHFNNNSQGQIAGKDVNGITESGAWVTPFLVDHNDGNIMFIGFKNVWRSTNIKVAGAGNVQWQKISTFGNSDLNVLVQAKANTNILYASSGNKFYFTNNAKDASVQWQVRTANLPASATITSIETHPLDENIVYIAQQTRIFKSPDQGLNWTEITANLSGIQINSIAYYHNSREGIYLGTDIGVFYRDASMNEWEYYTEGLPASVKVTEIEIFYDEGGPAGDLIRAATYGRGLWSVSPHYTAPTAGFIASATSISAGCTLDFTDTSTGTPFSYLWSFPGATPATSNEQNPAGIRYSVPGTYDVSLTVSNLLGTDTYTCTDCISVGEASLPEIQFEASAYSGCPELIVNFTDLTDHCPDNWIWDISPASYTFMQGTTNTSQNPVVKFNEFGLYDLRLTASNINGVATLLKQNLINIGGQPLPFSEDFEQQNIWTKGWIVTNPDNNKTWDIKTLADGNRAVWMNFNNYTNFNQRDYLESPPIDFSGFGEISLTFEYAYAQRYAQIDSLIVSVSDNCSNNWKRVYANGPDGQGAFETALPTLVAFEPQTDEDWCFAGSYGPPCPVINLNEFAGKTGVKIRFESFNQYGNNLYIDNIHLTALTPVAEKPEKTKHFVVYPNPAQKLIFVQTDAGDLGNTLRIADITGRTVLKMRIDRADFQISLADFAKGVYTLTIDQSTMSFKKLIVQ